MASLSNTELTGLATEMYHEKNDYIEYETGRDEQGRPRYIRATQGEILHGYDVDLIEEIGSPLEVFITTGDLMELTGYSRETIARRMEGLVDAGLFINHGDIYDQEQQLNANLYLPAEKSIKEKTRILCELDGRSIPPALTDRTAVTASDFAEVDRAESEGEFHYTADPQIVVNVNNPDTGSISEYVSQQLEQQGLVATDISNFTYQLRKRAGIVG